MNVQSTSLPWNASGEDVLAALDELPLKTELLKNTAGVHLGVNVAAKNADATVIRSTLDLEGGYTWTIAYIDSMGRMAERMLL